MLHLQGAPFPKPEVLKEAFTTYLHYDWVDIDREM